MKKIYFILLVVLVFNFGAFSSDTLRFYTPGTASVYFASYPVQIARFELPKPATIHSIIVTLGGDDASGSAKLHLYNHEGGNIIPELKQDLCDPLILQKTVAGDEQIQVFPPLPVYQSNNQFFVVVTDFQNGAKLASDNVAYSGFCLAGASGGDFYWEYLQTAAGTTTYQTKAFKIDVLLDYEQIPSPPYLEDVTAAVGIANENYSNRGLSVADFDNDGDEDMIRRNLLLRNDGGTFTDITSAAGISGNPYAGAFADMDNDGLLDVVFALADTIYIYKNEGNEVFSKHQAAVAPQVSGYSGTQTLCVGDINNDKFPDIFIGRLWNTYPTPLPNYLYKNNGDLTLSDNTSAIYPNASLNLRRTRGGTFVDFDNDGDMDLYVTNYYLERDEFYRNNGDGTFTNIIVEKEMDLNATGSNHGTGGVWADYDNDGDMDLLLSQFAHPNYAVLYDHRGTTIYRNEGPPSYNFTDLIGSPTLDDDIQFEETHAGAAFGDLNNDGLLDFYISNFYNCRYSDVYIQKPDHRFQLKTLHYLPSQTINTGEDAIMFDFNNDGRRDVLTGYYNKNVVLFKNNCTEQNNFLQLTLRSTSGNAFALGGRATVYAGGQQFAREVFSGHGANMRDPYTLHFGLGQNQQIDSVVVKWPVQPPVFETFYNLAINSRYSLFEGGQIVGAQDYPLQLIESVYAFPNPSKGEANLMVKANTSGIINWELYDQLGRKVNAGTKPVFQNISLQICLNSQGQLLPAGLYFYRVSLGQGLAKTGKLIIDAK